MNVTNIIEVALNNRRTVEVKDSLFQYDYGQILKITDLQEMGILSPYQVYFSNDLKTGTAKPQMGDADGVKIPDEYLQTGKPVYAFFYLHHGESDGRTVHVVKIPVISRVAPLDEVPTEVEQSALNQAIAMIQEAAETLGMSEELIQQRINEATARILQQYIEDGVFDNQTLFIQDGTLPRTKVDSDFESTLVKADNSWQKSISDNPSNPTTGSWEATYDPQGYGKGETGIDPYNFALGQDKNVIGRLRGMGATDVPNGSQIFRITDTSENVHSYTGIDNALIGAYQLANANTRSLLVNYEPFKIEIKTEQEMAELIMGSGEERTFYLVEKDSGYEKYWYVKDQNGYYHWDNFGSSSTLVLSTLPNISDAQEDIDYIIGSGNDYQYYKFINGEWKLIAGTNAEVYTVSQSISIFGNGTPQSNNITADGTKGYYLNIDTLRIFHDEGEWGWIIDTPQIINIVSSTTKDYFIKFGTDLSYMHFRYDGTKFVQVGSSSYSKQETDELISDLTSTVNTRLNAQDSAITAVDGRVSALGNMVSDVTAGSTGIVVHYKDGTTTPVATKDATTVVEDVSKSEDGIKISYSDGTSENIEISGGGSGGDTSGSASITRITPSSTQCVYTRSCPISYTFTALDSSGDMVGDGSATWYVGGVRKATSTARQGDGITNTFDIGSYLAVGANTVRLVITVDTGGDTLKTVSKTWTVNAINMYLVWDYEDTVINEGSTFTLRLTAYGDLSKTLHIVFDDDIEHEFTTTITRSGVQQAFTFDALRHGSHMVEAYLTASVNGEDIISDSIYHDMIFVESGENAPVISCSFNQNTMTQYNTVQIPIMVYNPAALTSTVILAVNGSTVATWTNIDRTLHYWNYTPNDYGEKTLTITSGVATKTLTITVEKLDIDNEEISGYSFRLKASDLTGNPALQSWESNGVTASFSSNFDWNNGGLKIETDENGNVRQYICIKAGTTMTINHKLFSDDPTVYGKTFKIIFKANNVRDYEASIASCYADGIGLRMSAHESRYSSSGTVISVPYGEDEYVELEFDIYPAPTENNGSYRYMMAWADGVITTCRVYGASDNFTQSNQNQQNIVIGSNDCDIYIYMVKAYPNYMTRENHIVNFIADAPNAQEMVKRYNRNDILNVSGKISYEKLKANNPDCRVWLYDIPYLTVGKKDKVKNCSFNQFWQNGDQYYELSGTGTMTVQGTSSVKYIKGAANTDISFETLTDGNGNDLLANGVIDEDNYGKNYFVGNKNTGEITVFTVDENTELTPDCVPVERDSNGNVTKYIKALGYKINDDSCPISYSNTKVNFASCEQVNNMCNAIWYQRYNPYPSLTPRDCMEFAMGVQFIKDSGTIPDDSHFVLWGDNDYHMYSIANMGTSKKNVHLFHDLTNPLECCIEINDNNSEQMRMISDDLSDEDWSGDVHFGMRYPDTKNPSQAIRDAWQRLLTWMATNNPNAATDNLLSAPETYDNYTFKGHSRPGTQVLKGTTVTQYAGTYTHDTFNRRMAKMLSECEDYLVMDSLVYQFVYQERHTMVDNVAKNTFWSSSDLLHWDMSKAYDMDTSDGNNNQGQMVFDYGNEYNDDIGGMKVFNAADSVWFVFVANLYEACQTMFVNREAAGAWSATAYHNFFLSEQQKVPERCWNECYWYDYLRTYEQGISEEWMTFLDGGQKTHQRWHYEFFEELYDSSKYRGTTSTSQNINFRSYTPNTWAGVEPKSELTISMYNKMYLSMDVGTTALAPIKLERGQPYTVNFASAGMLNNTLIAINTAPMIQTISGLEQLYPDTCVFSAASRLRELTIGSTATGYQNTFLKSLSLSNNTMLERLNIQNLPNANTVLDLSNCPSLIYIDATGSAFTGYEFAVGGLLAEAYIESPTSLSLRNLYYLLDENFHVTSFSNLDTLRIESCDGIDVLAIVNAAINLQRLRLLGIDWVLPETTVLNRLIAIAGLNENGNNTPTSVLTGKVYVSGQIRNKELSNYSEAWANLDVTYDASSLITQFRVDYVNADENHTVLYTTYIDNDSLPIDPVALELISTPILESTQQYNYTFDSWDNITNPIYNDRTITAVYTRAVRTYTVEWYARPGILSKTISELAYGSEAIYEDENHPTPTWTDQNFHVFIGWDQSTGFIKENMKVNGVWDSINALPQIGTPMSQMTPCEIYAIGERNQQDSYINNFEEIPYTEITLGHDFNFTNVDSIEIGKDVMLTGIAQDQFVSGGYYFDGSHAFTTDIKLFAKDSPSFTMAIDLQFNTTTSNATLLSTYTGDIEGGFKIYYNGANYILKWGDTQVTIAYQKYRDIVVIRHEAGTRRIVVYTMGGFASTRYADSITVTPLVRVNSTITDEPLTFGAIKYPSGFAGYSKATIHWCKIWFDDLGDDVARKIAAWPREKIRMECWGKGKYYYENTLTPCKWSFISNSLIGGVIQRGYWMNTTNTNVGGWESSQGRIWLNNVFYNALPTEWQSIIKPVKIIATNGNKSTSITTSIDKIYLPSLREIGGSASNAGYIEEIGADGDSPIIPWMISNCQRIKFKGSVRKYGEEATIYSCAQEPALLYQIDIEPGTIWINTNNNSSGYIFISQEELDQYGITPDVVADTNYAHGGWVLAQWWWLRSPNVSYSTYFMYVYTSGSTYYYPASNVSGFAPGFSL